MLAAAEDSAFTGRWDLYRGTWSAAALIFGTVDEESAGTGVYRVAFPPEPETSEYFEEWQYNSRTGSLAPLNSGALITAVVLFCDSQDDPSPYCVGWFDDIDRIKSLLDR